MHIKFLLGSPRGGGFKPPKPPPPVDPPLNPILVIFAQNMHQKLFFFFSGLQMQKFPAGGGGGPPRPSPARSLRSIAVLLGGPLTRIFDPQKKKKKKNVWLRTPPGKVEIKTWSQIQHCCEYTCTLNKAWLN